MAYLLTLSNLIIVPKLVDSFHSIKCFKKCFDRTVLIFLMRTLTTVILPFIISFLLLDYCGNLWSIFWNPCNNQNSKALNLKICIIYNYVNSDYCYLSMTLFSPDQICQTQQFQNINLNKCLRQFYDVWSTTIITKCLLVTITPTLVYFFTSEFSVDFGN